MGLLFTYHSHCAPCNTFGEQREIYEWIGLFLSPPENKKAKFAFCTLKRKGGSTQKQPFLTVRFRGALLTKSVTLEFSQGTVWAVINQEHCQSCPEYVSSLKDVHAYSVLKVDPRASLPSSFTICISVLVTTYNLNPLFTLLGSDGQPWFSAEIDRIGLFGGRSFYDRVASQFAKSDTIRMFPNQWVRICSVFNTSAWSNGLHEESLWAALLLRRLQTMHCL